MNVRLQRVAIAINDMDAMLRFYNTVFDAGLRAIPNSPGYSGTIAGIGLLFFPNAILEIKAEKNRQQLTLIVDDLDTILSTVREAGGTHDEIQENGPERVAGVTDPDGNTIELIQTRSS